MFYLIVNYKIDIFYFINGDFLKGNNKLFIEINKIENIIIFFYMEDM